MAMAAQGMDEAEKEVQSQSLSGQVSGHNFTVSQVQNHLGEPFLSMNLEDLLRSAFPAGEDSRSPAVDAGALSKKTVDEVGRQIQRGKEQERQHPSWGEMTLEDFLCRAGVVGDGPNEDGGYQVAFAPTAHWLHRCHPRRRRQQQKLKQKQKQKSITGSSYACHQPAPQPLAAATGSMSETTYHEVKGANSSPVNPQTPRRKRGHLEDAAKKTVERRQKRMIKNRESAARSRARKQAYTNELENKVSRLEEENQRLKKHNELDAMIHHIPRPDPKQQLRRTSSATF